MDDQAEGATSSPEPGRGPGSSGTTWAWAAKRIDVLAPAIQAGLTVDEVVELDLGYAAPFGPVWDPVHLVARRLLTELEAS